MIAKVLVDIKSKNVDKTYDYIIPPEFEKIIEIGARVIVPFGTRKIMGFCLEISKTSDYAKELKELITVIDVESYLSEDLIDLARQLRAEMSTLLITILETMLPAALKVVYKPKLKVVDKEKLSENISSLFAYTDQLLLESIPKELYDELQKDIKNNSIKQIYDIEKRNQSLTKKYAELVEREYDRLSEKQTLLIEYLKKKPEHRENIKTITVELGITVSVINTLEKHGYLKVYQKEVYRKVEPIKAVQDKEIVLNQEQTEAYNKVMAKLDENQIFLLHGVTGSGKTEIYIKVIEQVIKNKKTVIFLVPEISLTPMMMARFKAKFGSDVAMLHSGLSVLEKYDEWRRISKGEAKIVIGARSACFAPVKNLGLVVVDECHESTYKQDVNPKYYAVDVLKIRAKVFGCPVILGSATPNIESYARYSRGYYELLELKNRALDSKMPNIEVIDMKEEFKKGNNSSFSEKLIAEIGNRLNKKEQVILLLNRRGHSNFVICRNCGYVFTCENCDISLTYHEYSHNLKCHYCNHEEPVPKECKRCHSTDLRFMGTGTQKVEYELKELFPEANIIRMDNDTTRKKNAHEKLLNQFGKNGDILIGTQMIAKGLDFPRVTLVGIIQADNNLYVPDFRAPEKTFQLIMQVSGRSGRRNIPGNVIIQAFNPDHYAIRFACDNDYHGFYEHEMRIRKIAKYAPFYFLTELTIIGKNMRDIFYMGMEIVKYMKRNLSKNAIVLGPAVPIVNRINNRYRCNIIIKYREEPDIDKVLYEVGNNYGDEDSFVSIDRFPNVG